MSNQEIVPINLGGQHSLAPQHNALAVQPVGIDALVERVTLIKDAMKRCMVEGQHYGTIPGTKKPSLWKPGAELICTLFQLGPRFPGYQESVERIGEHFLFNIRCELVHIPSGRVVGEGMGACTTLEYKYRTQTEAKTYPNGNVVPSKYTPYDFYNTVLKMAKKRALVDAVLSATAASEIFTQDTEDNPDLHKDLEQPEPPRPAQARVVEPEPVPPPKPKVESVVVQGVLDSVEQKMVAGSDGKEVEAFYGVLKSDAMPDYRIRTLDRALGQRMELFKSQYVKASVYPVPGTVNGGKLIGIGLDSVTGAKAEQAKAAAPDNDNADIPADPLTEEEGRALEAKLKAAEAEGIELVAILQAAKNWGAVNPAVVYLQQATPGSLRAVLKHWDDLVKEAKRLEDEGEL